MGVLFKTALVGGFQKEEVIEYIEKLKNDWAEEERRLQEELRQTREEEKRAWQQQEEKKEENLRLEEELSQAREQIRTLEEEKEQACRQAEQARQRAETLRREYGELKEYIADIEISAYKRAREVQEEASRHAQEVTQTIKDAGAVMTPVAEEAREKVVMAEEAFSGFKARIASITGEIDELVRAMNEIEQRSRHTLSAPPPEEPKAPIQARPAAPKKSDSQPQPAGTRLRSIQEILDRVKNIGEKM